MSEESHVTKRSNEASRHAEESTAMQSRRLAWIGLILAPILAVIVWLVMPAEYRVDSSHGQNTAMIMGSTGCVVAAVGVCMAVLWVTEALPVAVTSLLPLVLFPLLTASAPTSPGSGNWLTDWGLAPWSLESTRGTANLRGGIVVQTVSEYGGRIDMVEAAKPYADPIVFLFMGGFMLALAMEQWGLHRRIALRIMLLAGSKPASLVAGFMIASALLSMWVSNTATVVMMLPIATSVIALVRREMARSGQPIPTESSGQFNFAVCILLGTAYAASIGGVGTLIGSPPNALMAGFLRRQGFDISFAKWMLIGVPFVVVFIPIAWAVLTRWAFPIRIKEIPGGRALIRREIDSLGCMSRAEFAVLIIFVLTAGLWITRPWLEGLTVGEMHWQPLRGLNDAVIAIGAALVLFVLPANLKGGEFLLTWSQAAKLPWGTLILFGGGLSLASAVQSSGLANFIGFSLQGLRWMDTAALVVLIIVVLVFLTELTSNTATIATFLPILAAMAVGSGRLPAVFVIPATISVSLAFMMPVATPPNAIVFASGEVTIRQMCRAGLMLNVLGIVLVLLFTWFDALPLLMSE